MRTKTRLMQTVIPGRRAPRRMDNRTLNSRLSALAIRNRKATAVVVSALLYALGLAFFFSLPIPQIFILSVVPVLTTAWMYGLSGAAISTVAVTIVHVLLLLFSGGSPVAWLTVDGGGVGTLATLLISSLIGQISSLRTRLASEQKELIQTQDVTIFALAYEAELRDQATGKHLERTSAYVRILAEELARSQQYSDYLTKQYVSDLVRAAPLHDIGKVGIPDSILLKPDKLTAAEFLIMREHCELGAQVLRKADEQLEFQSFLRIAVQLVLSHHEKWDGTGYPAQLKSDRIPISGRIMAMADAYDALRSDRTYKNAIQHSRCVEIIVADSGSHFDPDVVDAFLRRQADFNRISTVLVDTTPQTGIPELEPVDGE
jgi:HD domain-containing protein